jgi:DNA-binding GntR family transcriptional regulator
LSRDEIVRALEDDIMDGTIQPGERVDERVLAERFRISRAPVRDAIGRLASLGLIDVNPRSGSYVTRLDVAELFQLFEVMAELESVCASDAAQRMDPEERAALRGIAEAGVQAAKAGAMFPPAPWPTTWAGLRSSAAQSAFRSATFRSKSYESRSDGTTDGG